MNHKQILTLLNNKSVTVEHILLEIKNLIEIFQSEREDFYVNEFCHATKKRKKFITDMEINEKSQEIFESVQADTESFVLDYIAKSTDFVLDSINENKVHVEAAHAFLLILTTTKEVFLEQKVDQDDV